MAKKGGKKGRGGKKPTYKKGGRGAKKGSYGKKPMDSAMGHSFQGKKMDYEGGMGY